ncbi:hypothetical protein vnz_04970 [Streptomyces venezuelae]|nr:hypothetical protein vnz_04970 [Streptomyces venezuelae]
MEEAGKAANMPKDRKDIAAWWRSLAPVTRGILLKEKGDELRAAGILDPQYQWHSPDPGSGPFNVEDPTPRDVQFHALALGLATVGDNTGETGASRNMLHYLRGTGETLDVDVNRMLHDDAKFRSDIEEIHIARNQEEWRRKALAEFEKAGGDKPVTIPVESHQYGGTFTKDTDWYHALGSHQQTISGMVTVRPGEGGKPDVSLDYQVNVWDRYNWDKGHPRLERRREPYSGPRRPWPIGRPRGRLAGRRGEPVNRRPRTRGSFFVALISALVLTSCSTGAPGSARESTYPYWEKGAGATEAAAFMKIQIPKGATDVKGAVQVNPREDMYILSFRTGKATAAQVADVATSHGWRSTSRTWTPSKPACTSALSDRDRPMALPGLSEKDRHTLARRYGLGVGLMGASQRSWCVA